MKPIVHRKRHIAKTITWRIVGSLDTFLLGTFFSGSLTIGGWIAFSEVLTKTILYYFHERIWVKINFSDKRLNKNTKRHAVKTFSWRLIGTLDTLLLSWIFTGSPLTGLKIASGEIIS